MTERIEIEFDHHAPEMVDNMVETYAELREKCPVAYSNAHGGYWVVSSHRLVAEALGRHQDFSSENDPDGKTTGYGGNTVPPAPAWFGLVQSDPPYWTGVRRLMNPLFSPPAVERLKPLILDVTTAFLDRIIEKGEGDVIEDIASPIPAVLTLSIMGVPLNLWRTYADAMHHLNTSAQGTPAGEAAAAELAIVMEDLQREIDRRMKPGYSGDDVFSQLCTGEVNGERLTAEQLMGEAILLVNGGVDTTTSLIGSSLAWLQEHPAERERLRSDRELMPLATEEFLRYFAPVTAMARTATRQVELGGQTIEEGEPVLMSFVAANRDPLVFESPDELRLDRWPNRHTSFGLGIHRCIGSNFARAIIQTVLWEVLTRLRDLEVDVSAGEKYPDFGVNQGWVNLPMRFTPGERIGHEIVLPD